MINDYWPRGDQYCRKHKRWSYGKCPSCEGEKVGRRIANRFMRALERAGRRRTE